MAFTHKDFEKKLFSDKTNHIFCKTFLENALLDPVTGEIGKTIIFCVRQNHAAKIVQILNELADKMFPGRYQSDFAVQVTSSVSNAQQFTINFTNNNLNGRGNFQALYKTSKTRVCATVGMMTTGYDCQDLLNICLMRPIFSPTDFIQIKGRGTRTWDFTNKEVLKDGSLIENVSLEHFEKTRFKLFDFFANCEYFEEKFNYDEVIKLPKLGGKPGEGTEYHPADDYDSKKDDPLHSYHVKTVGEEGMRIDRMYFNRFEEKVKEDANVQQLMEKQDYDAIAAYILQNIFDKPEEYFNLEKLRKAAKVDRRISLQEIIEKVFGLIPYFKNKEELLEDEFEKFDSRYLPDEKYFNEIKNYFKSYISDEDFRKIIEDKQYALLNTNPNGEVFRKLPKELRDLIPDYIKDNVSLNKFMA
jgi:type I restriction enzyme R subunit